MTKYIEKYAPLIFFILLTVFGLRCIPDFGVSFDEHVNRRNGGVSANYVITELNTKFDLNLFNEDQELAKFDTKLSEYKDRDYGVVIDLPIFIFERVFGINDSRDQYLLRHYIIYLIFIIGSICLYKVILYRHESMILGLVAVLMLVLSPRVFADAFYNIKDLVFMSVFIVGVLTTIKFINKINFKNILLHSIITAIAIDIRIVALIFPIGTTLLLLVKLIRKEIHLYCTIKALISYLMLTLLLTVMLWPWLWEHPINNFIEAFNNMSRFRWDGWILFKGIYYPAAEVPRHYLPYWILITTPLMILFLNAFGVYSIIKKIISNKFKIWVTKDELNDLICLTLFVSPLILVIIKKPIIYDGWRQFYFIYPIFIMIAIKGLDSILKFKMLNKAAKLIIYIALFVQAIVNVAWMYQSYPYWNVYFNYLVGRNWGEQFERDYWGLSSKKGLDFILANDSRSKIYVYGHGHSTIKETIEILDKKDRHRIAIVDNTDKADYLMFNYRIFQPEEMEKFNQINAKNKKFYDIKIDGNPILTILKF